MGRLPAGARGQRWENRLEQRHLHTSWLAGCGGTHASDAERPEADTSRRPQAAMEAAERPDGATMET